jgi:hypothetical protein
MDDEERGGDGLLCPSQKNGTSLVLLADPKLTIEDSRVFAPTSYR